MKNKFYCKETEEINNFLKTKNYSNKLLLLGGFNYLVNKWKSITQQIPYSASYQLDDYLHDVQIRALIFDIEKNCDVISADQKYIENIDNIFLSKTIKVPCIWKNSNLVFDSDVYWFYFRVPYERIPNWYSEASVEMQLYTELARNAIKG